MKKFLQIVMGLVIIVFVGLYLLFNQTLPISYGKIVFEGNYDGLMTDEYLKLYDNGVFHYTDGSTNWNGEYELKKDSIILDYYFPVNQPTIYLIEDPWIKSYKIKNGKNFLVHDLKIRNNKLFTSKHKQ